MGVAILQLQLILLVLVLLLNIQGSDAVQQFIVQKYKYGVSIKVSVNSSVEYIFEHDDTQKLWNDDPTRPDSGSPARVHVVSSEATRNNPIFITARQQKGILSWQLPVVIDDKEMDHLSRTLCPNKNYFITDSSESIQNHTIINVYTSSDIDIVFSLEINLVENFYLFTGENHATVVSPSTPQVFFYAFGDNVTRNDDNLQSVTTKTNAREKKTVVLRFDSDDDLCMLISIQNASCPIFDTENDIMFEGFYETVTRRGGITISSSRFPLGFYLVLVVKTSDEVCTGFSQNSSVAQFTNFFDFESQPYDVPIVDTRKDSNALRMKNVQILIQPSISYGEYWLATMSALIAIIIVYIIFLSGLCFYKFKPFKLEEVDHQDPINNENIVENNLLITSSVVQSNPQSVTNPNCNSSIISLGSPESCGKIYLNQLCTRNCKDIKRQSGLYLWHLITIAIFYGLPVIQLVITYQRVLNNSGNQDLCYYNFLCAHPVGLLSDFNHVFSNFGYVLLGALFIFFTWRKHKQFQDAVFEQSYGIPPHHGLFYAMGVALIMEGVLSASYHVCPNHSNFQFDTSFMYIMAVLCMVKIYQTRHPDINARAHSTFSMLAGAILICLFGVLYPNFYFWLFFTILHVGMCLLMTFQIYYMGQWKFNFCCCSGYKCGDICHPIYRSRCILVVIANLCNWGLAFWGLYHHSKDFATHLLYVFLMNLALHLAFYITMKVANGERPPIYTWLLLVTAMITWGGALFFFFSPSTSWALTPAESRTFNTPCKLLNFYDYHDIWHMLSAAAMFFSFMLLLTLDDDIMHKPHSKIPVF
ncbi:SID1 transmembrane family member 1-like isoform X2 [Arctopsyche grandis]|uniref:SID1 transmembrane family member 1-like isoform X2 n=1 Tax=Arctopsyche grandis TaxID=121162 RepID=UPI00406D9D58